MQYKFENEVVLKVPKKLMIVATNLQICYLIIKISYANLLLITKLIILGIKFKIFKEISFANDCIAKLRRKKKLNQHIPKQFKTNYLLYTKIIIGTMRFM